MMNLHIIKLFLIVLLIVAAPACDSDQQAKSPVKIGISSGIEIFLPTIKGFKLEMTKMGYIEGKNVLYVSRSAKGEVKGMKEIAEEFAKSDIDLLFTTTNGGVMAAKKALAGKNLPIVFTIVLAPVTSGEAMFSFGKKHNIPIVASSSQQLKKGALFSYNVDDRLVGVQAASLVDKILKKPETHTHVYPYIVNRFYI